MKWWVEARLQCEVLEPIWHSGGETSTVQIFYAHKTAAYTHDRPGSRRRQINLVRSQRGFPLKRQLARI